MLISLDRTSILLFCFVVLSTTFDNILDYHIFLLLIIFMLKIISLRITYFLFGPYLQFFHFRFFFRFIYLCFVVFILPLRNGNVNYNFELFLEFDY